MPENLDTDFNVTMTKKEKNEMASRRISLDEKIERQQHEVINARQKYDAEMEKLKKLADKRKAIQKEDLLNAIKSSDKSVEEIMNFLKSPKSEEDE